jgi:hypothetical protein
MRHRTNIGRLAGAALLLLVPLLPGADVVDRVAVVVGKSVITESEVRDCLRVTGFLNGEALDFSPQARRAAAERLVDQQLLRNEMDASRMGLPTAAESDAVFQQFFREHFHDTNSYAEALAKYGVTDQQVKEELTWQLALLRFTDLRFRSELTIPSESTATQSGADRQAPPAANSVDQQMEAWLKDARSNTRVTFKAEAFR